MITNILHSAPEHQIGLRMTKENLCMVACICCCVYYIRENQIKVTPLVYAIYFPTIDFFQFFLTTLLYQLVIM